MLLRWTVRTRPLGLTVVQLLDAAVRVELEVADGAGRMHALWRLAGRVVWISEAARC